jgi:UDP-N-acetylmuramoyl-tripeptide--D-alanyl-D-alanine ligase
MSTMPSFTVEEVVRGTKGALVGGDLSVPVAAVSIDSRTLGVGEAFFAIRGHRLDGHAFLAEAVGRGAACLVVHSLPDDLPPGVAVVFVEDTTRALGRFAAWHRARFAIPMAAVTGSAGKTSTKEMMAAVLEALGPVLKPTASFNNQWGLPLTLLRLGPEHRAAALELGANMPGEIAALAAIARPTIAALTMVAPVHIELLGSVEGVQREKAALVQAIAPEGAVVLNADDPRVLAMRAESRARVLTVSATGPADVRALGISAETVDGFTLALDLAGAARTVRLAFAGRHHAVNALVAAGVGLAAGVAADEIVHGLAAARPVRGRGVWRRARAIVVLDDTYNASPTSVRTALATLALAGATRRVVVLGDMLELGTMAEAAHREIGGEIAASGAAELVGMGTLARIAVEAARAAGLAESHHAPTFEDAVALLLKRVTQGDAVLVKGSRGMRMERVVDALMARFGGDDG